MQRIAQPDEHEVVFGLYAGGREYWLLLSADPVFARAHLVTKRPRNQPEPPGFLAALRSRLQDAHLKAVEQVRFDRMLHLTFEGEKGRHTLVAELMGKHSNLVLLDEAGRILAVIKPVPPTKSSRPLLGGHPYVAPPFPPKPPIWEAREGDDPKGFEGGSPFLLKLAAAEGAGYLEDLGRRVETGSFVPVLSPGHGAYPLSVAALGLQEFRRESLSIALEQHYALAVPEHHASILRTSLRANLERVLLAREVALSELEQSVEAAAKAPLNQLYGELILAYGSSLHGGESELEAIDYEGNPVRVKLDPELSALENANRYFEKAKKAKGRIGLVQDQIARLGAERDEVAGLLARLDSAERLVELEDLRDRAASRRWLHTQAQRAKSGKAEDRPYEGHRIRELVGPGGYRILYGETASANDYLTMRVAKPSDWWLHVRGAVSAHVVILTGKQPEKVQRETLLFAAKVAVANSPSKHSGYVPVDYTLKKYVRKPKGAPAGTALYTHEKTLHVEP